MHVYACNYCNYMHVSISMFSRRNDLLVENLCFRRFYPPQFRLKPSQRGFPGTYGITVGIKNYSVPGLPGGENHVMLDH